MWQDVIVSVDHKHASLKRFQLYWTLLLLPNQASHSARRNWGRMFLSDVQIFSFTVITVSQKLRCSCLAESAASDAFHTESTGDIHRTLRVSVMFLIIL